MSLAADVRAPFSQGANCLAARSARRGILASRAHFEVRPLIITVPSSGIGRKWTPIRSATLLLIWGAMDLIELIGLFVVCLASAIALALHGVLSISGDYDDVVRIAREIVGTLSTSTSRLDDNSSSLAVTMTPPLRSDDPADAWLLVVDSTSTDWLQLSQLVTRDQLESGAAAIHVDNSTSQPIEVSIGLFDLATLTPVAFRRSIIPPAAIDAPPAGFLGRITGAFRSSSTAESFESKELR